MLRYAYDVNTFYPGMGEAISLFFRPFFVLMGVGGSYFIFISVVLRRYYWLAGDHRR